MKILLALCVLLSASCNKDNTPRLTLDPMNIEAEAGIASSVLVTVSTNADSWKVVSDRKWAGVVKHSSSTGFYVNVSKNQAASGKIALERDATITVTAGELVATVHVHQKGEDPVFSLEKKTENVGKNGGELVVKLNTNLPYTLGTLPEWIEDMSTKTAGAETRYFSVQPNKTASSRSAYITFIAQGMNLRDSVLVNQQEGDDKIRILAIGNSFSTDAVQYLYDIFKAAGQEVIVGNMYVGSCTLKMHADYAKKKSVAYTYYKFSNGNMDQVAGYTLQRALTDENWDYISIQEGGGWHGYYNLTYKIYSHSMEPDMTNLINYIKATSKNPDFVLMYHSPWSGKKGYTDIKFSYYDYDQDLMNQMVRQAVQDVMKAHSEFGFYINSMDAIQNARSSYFGDTLNRDGWHLNLLQGRYTVSCLWYEKISGKSVLGNSFKPEGMSAQDAFVCQTAAHEANLHPLEDTDLSYIPKN